MQLGPSEPANTLNAEQYAEQPIHTKADLAADSANPQANADLTLENANPNPVAIENLIDRLSSPDTLFVFGVLLLVVIMFRMLRKNYKSNARRSNSQPSPQDRIEQINTRARNSMEPSERVMVQAEEMARRLGATLDNKAARLELLIEEADRKLAILNRSLSTATPSPQVSAPQTPSPRTIDPSLLDRARMEQDLEERQTRVVGRIDPEPTLDAGPLANEPTNQPTNEPINRPIAEPTPDAHQPPPKDPQESIQTQIVELAATGLSNIDIAHRLNHPIGQVELILNLRKRQG